MFHMKKCSGNTYHIFFRNLANPVKTKIISALKEKEMCVNELSKKTGLEQSKLSHALAALRNCSIVNVKQKGKERIYHLNKETIIPMLRLIDKHKCKFCKYNKK